LQIHGCCKKSTPLIAAKGFILLFIARDNVCGRAVAMPSAACLDSCENGTFYRDSIASCRSRVYCLLISFCWLGVAVLTCIQLFYLVPSNMRYNALVETKCHDSLQPLATIGEVGQNCSNLVAKQDHLFLSWCEMVPFEQSWSAGNVMARAIGIVGLSLIVVLLLAAFVIGRSGRHGCVNIQCGCFTLYWIVTILATFLQIFCAAVVVRDARMRYFVAQSSSSSAFSFSLDPVDAAAATANISVAATLWMSSNATAVPKKRGAREEGTSTDADYLALLDLNVIIYSLSALLAAFALFFEGIITAVRERSYFVLRRAEKMAEKDSSTSTILKRDLKKLNENWN
jgi:hypothetical protein